MTAPASATKVALELRYQGCHQVDPKICFPPQKVVLNIDLPAAAAGAGAAPTSLSAALAAPAPGAGILGDNQPLPPEQAFVYEAIATSANEVLARFTMPKGYYLYRDKTSFRLADGADGKLGAPRWPAGQQHTDENFGATTVYFNQVEVPLPVSRSDAAARSVNVESSFQGCKENSVCYPVMTRQVRVDPAGRWRNLLLPLPRAVRSKQLRQRPAIWRRCAPGAAARCTVRTSPDCSGSSSSALVLRSRRACFR